MKVYVYPADAYGCGHLRMVWPTLAVQQLDPTVDATIVAAGDPTGLSVYSDDAGRAVDVTHPECDLIVFQRPTFPKVAAAIPILRAKGIAVVVDIDDDLSHIHPDNPAWRAMHPEAVQVQIRDDEGQMREARMLPWELDRDMAGRQFVTVAGRHYAVLATKPAPHSWQAVGDACRSATMTTVSTPQLRQVYGGGNAHVLYNYVPRAALDVQREDSDVVGWAGSTHSHPGDLRAMGAAIARLGCRFEIVGDGTGADRELGLPAPVPDTGPVDFAEWPRAVARIGVGVAPLADSRFNAAKSWLKPLEYSAAGVPWVASPRAEYRRLTELGAGELAEKPREWERALRRLVSDAGYRAERSAQAREVARGLTIEGHAWRWLEAWRMALDRQRATAPQAV